MLWLRVLARVWPRAGLLVLLPFETDLIVGLSLNL